PILFSESNGPGNSLRNKTATDTSAFTIQEVLRILFFLLFSRGGFAVTFASCRCLLPVLFFFFFCEVCTVQGVRGLEWQGKVDHRERNDLCDEEKGK
ncbi:hypothetical protein BKA57DRAFT_410133, partial [Linnemannia elongata]